ncbi:hypothetical protein ACFY8K_33950 [Streptomyces misionensis]|uniref:hypothetical protein n=1 Tax=Streptomyces misionensis TaxID=67331 RepID=UPI0036D19808
MRALEDIRNQVRSAKSRRYIDEAIAAYNGGAYRSALIAIWIAVAADLIEKLRFLADEGDANATAHRDKLDAAIKDNKINELQKFERELLAKAHQDLQLIGMHERDQLLRLYEDRHLCAHPAFVPDSDDLFNPTAESVRAHLRVAVDAVLSQQAVTGRKALDRFGRDIASASFPRNDNRLADHLRASYMDHGTPQLRANLIKIVCKETFNQEKDSTWRWNHTRTARELQKIAPGEFEEHARSALERKQNELDDEGLIALVTGLCHVPGVWELLHAGTRARIEELLKNVSAHQLVIVHQLYNGPLPAAPVDRMLLDRLSEAIGIASRSMHFAQLTPFLGDAPDRRLIPPLIELVAEASSYEGGEAVLKWVNALSPSLTEDDLQQLLTAAADNNQISGSVLGTRQLGVLRSIGPQGEQATDAWSKWDTRWAQNAEPTASNP